MSGYSLTTINPAHNAKYPLQNILKLVITHESVTQLVLADLTRIWMWKYQSTTSLFSISITSGINAELCLMGSIKEHCSNELQDREAGGVILDSTI